MATKTKGKGAVVALAGQLIAGTGKHLANEVQVMLLGNSLTPAQVTAQLQAIVNLRNDVDAAKALTKAKLAVEIADMPARRILMDAFVTFVKVAFGNAPDVLADFGLHPKARTPLTVGQDGCGRKAQGNARSAAYSGFQAEEERQRCRHRHRRDARHCRATRRDGARQPERPCDQHGRDGYHDIAARHVSPW